jgi:hypothetical protein
VSDFLANEPTEKLEKFRDTVAWVLGMVVAELERRREAARAKGG